MPYCRSCGALLNEQARFCEKCGVALASDAQIPTGSHYPVAAHRPPYPEFIGGQVAAVIGCLMLIIGPFLSWLDAVVFASVGFSGLQKTNNEALILVGLGVIGVVICAISFAGKRRRIMWVTFVLALVGVLLSILYLTQLQDMVAEAKAEDYVASLGAGIYLCLVGSVLALLGALTAAFSRKR